MIFAAAISGFVFASVREPACATTAEVVALKAQLAAKDATVRQVQRLIQQRPSDSPRTDENIQMAKLTRQVAGAVPKGGGAPEVPPVDDRSTCFHAENTYLDANNTFDLESVNPNKHHKYVVYYPRAGFGNRMMSLVSTITLAVATGRGLYLAPDGEDFPCRSYLDSAVCDWTMPGELKAEYNAKANVKELNPDAYFPAACKPASLQYRSVQALMCDDLCGINEKFLSANSCQYWGPLIFSNNRHASMLKPLLSAGVFRTIWKPLLGPSEPRHFGGKSTECDVGVHVRMNMNTDEIDSVLLPCLETISKRPDSPITLASMWPDVRAHVKKRLGDRVKWFTATTPDSKDKGAIAADLTSVVTDVRALGVCNRILMSKPAGRDTDEAFSTLTMLMFSLGPELVSMENCAAVELTEPASHLLAKDLCKFGDHQEKCGYMPKELGYFNPVDEF